MNAFDHLYMLSSQAPAMAERLWDPHGSRTFEGYTIRVNAKGKLLGTSLTTQGLVLSASAQGHYNAQLGCLSLSMCSSSTFPVLVIFAERLSLRRGL